MEVLVGAIVIVFVLIMGFRAFAGYSSYKGTIYQQLFSSYLEYFWRMSMQRDLSKSNYLHERIGEHRIVYNAYRDGQGRIAATFATVFSTHGHAAICVQATSGAVAGKDTGSWTVERDGKRYILSSPVTYVRRQKKLLDSFMKGAPVEYIVAFNTGADLSAVDCSCTVLTIDKVVEHLEQMPAGTATEAEVLHAFNTFKEMAVNAG
ncbi:hypothetical protein [uncultured Enorma sp.]|uniref:hypothetical protein n=1 Tax=uncultured Enorma sp. TaxID=1714346 RepID=UPI002805F1ED|nr:hypothetical protein [uncultured Enorma sp.]